MANGSASTEQMSQQVRDIAERSISEAKRAVDDYMEAAKRAASSIEGSVQAAQATASDVNRKAITFAEANVDAAFDFAERLIRCKDPKEILSLQQEFARTQMEQFNRQMRELSDASGWQQGAMGRKK
jgi:phasin